MKIVSLIDDPHKGPLKAVVLLRSHRHTRFITLSFLGACTTKGDRQCIWLLKTEGKVEVQRLPETETKILASHQ